MSETYFDGPSPEIIKAAREQRAGILSQAAGPPPVRIRVASMPGTCSGCGMEITPGEQIAYLPEWIHLACATCARCGGWNRDYAPGQMANALCAACREAAA